MFVGVFINSELSALYTDNQRYIKLKNAAMLTVNTVAITSHWTRLAAGHFANGVLGELCRKLGHHNNAIVRNSGDENNIRSGSGELSVVCTHR